MGIASELLDRVNYDSSVKNVNKVTEGSSVIELDGAKMEECRPILKPIYAAGVGWVHHNMTS